MREAAPERAAGRLLQVENLTAAYGDVQVLWDVSLEARAGEIVVLVGANGAGKTTTVRAVSGMLKPQGGRIEFDGTRIDGLDPSAVVGMGVAHLPEGRALFPTMTVLENLLMGGFLPAARRRRRENLEMVLEIFPRLRERARQLAGTLSGGEQQMCAIARGLMSQPRLFMLDEPSLGLAPVVVDEIFEVIGRIRRQGVTVLLVEQNVALALEVADRAYVLEQGRVVLTGSGRELLDHPGVRTAYLGA